MTLSARTSGIAIVFFLIAACKSGDAGSNPSATGATVPDWPLSTKSEEARNYIRDGERAADEGRFEKSYEQFKRSVAADSAFAFGYLRVAQTSQSFDEYRTNLQRAVTYAASANPTEKLFIEMEQKGFARDQQGALESAQALVAALPQNPRALTILAFRQDDLGQRAEAQASLKKAVDLAPEYGGVHLNYGGFFLTDPGKDLVKAEQAILAGQKLWPDQPNSHDLLGDVRRAQGRLREAAEAYSRQIELSPQDANGYQQRGHTNVFLGEYDKARADYSASIRLGKGNVPAGFAQFRAYVDIYAGEPEKALAELEQLIQAIDGMGIPEPEGMKASIFADKSTIASHIHKFDVAEAANKKVDSLGKRFVERSGSADVKRGEEIGRTFRAGRLAAFKGDYALAQSKAREIMKLRELERNPTRNRGAHAIMGFAALFQKRYAEAVTEFEQGDPGNIYQQYHRALALEGAGRKDEAKAIFKEVAGFNFSNTGYALVRADAIARSK